MLHLWPVGLSSMCQSAMGTAPSAGSAEGLEGEVSAEDLEGEVSAEGSEAVDFSK